MKFNYKVGDKAIIIREICGHQFDMGEIVTIVEAAEHPEHFQASDGKETWYVSVKECIPYEIVKKRIMEEIKNEKS